MTPYTRTYDRLSVISLDPEQHERTCNYWYLVRDSEMAHTAFTEKAHLLMWLEARGLKLTADLPADRGVWSWQKVDGAYRQALHMDMDTFNALQGERTRGLQNGDYTLTIITLDNDGRRTEHKLNPNVKDRPVYDYQESRALVG